MRRVVTLGEVAIDPHELEPDDLEAASLVTREDPADQLALDAVGLDEDESTFAAWHVFLAVGRVLDEAGLYRMSGGDQPGASPCVSADASWTVCLAVRSGSIEGRHHALLDLVCRRLRPRRRVGPVRPIGPLRRAGLGGGRSGARSAPTLGQPAARRGKVGLPGLVLVAGQPVRIAADDEQVGRAGACGRLEDGRGQRRGDPQGEAEVQDRFVEFACDEAVPTASSSKAGSEVARAKLPWDE